MMRISTTHTKVETNYLRIINDIKSGTFNQYNSSTIQFLDDTYKDSVFI